MRTWRRRSRQTTKFPNSTCLALSEFYVFAFEFHGSAVCVAVKAQFLGKRWERDSWMLQTKN